MEKVDFRFLISGEGPEFGIFTAGDIRRIEKATAETLEARGVGEIIKEQSAAPKRAKEGGTHVGQ